MLEHLLPTRFAEVVEREVLLGNVSRIKKRCHKNVIPRLHSRVAGSFLVGTILNVMCPPCGDFCGLCAKGRAARRALQQALAGSPLMPACRESDGSPPGRGALRYNPGKSSGSVPLNLLVFDFCAVAFCPLVFFPAQQETMRFAVLVRVGSDDVTFKVDAKWPSAPGSGDVNGGELTLAILKAAKDACHRIQIEADCFATRVDVPDTSG